MIPLDLLPRRCPVCRDDTIVGHGLRLRQSHDDQHAVYKKRNEIDRLFRRLKGFRRIFSRFEKLDVLFLGFLSFALIVEALRVV